ncbi:MAG: tRNA pseudouridine(55) synthase TruB, partial [Oscillospiraceae bacterium]
SLRAAILPADLARLFINGFAFETLRLPVKVGDGERVRVRDTEGNFLGLGESDENRFKKIRQFWFG